MKIVPTPEHAATIRSMSDTETGDICFFLRLYIGMPVKIKTNQCISKGVANGAFGTVFHVDRKANTEFTRQSDGIWLASDQPAYIFVNIENCPSSVRFPGLPSSWPHSVMPVHKVTSGFSLNGTYYSIKGFPVVPAFGITVHGVQGESRDNIAITNLRTPHLRRVDHHALYVALSRVRTREGLHWLGSQIPEADFEYFRPSQATLDEDTRLQELAHHTEERFRHERAADITSLRQWINTTR